MSEGWGRPGRRGVLVGGVAAGAVAATAAVGWRGARRDGEDPPAPHAIVAVQATGDRQAGVDRPGRAQEHLALAVYSLPHAPAARALGDLGVLVAALAGGADPRTGGLEPGDLTVTVGVGPALVGAVDPRLPGAAPLPSFAGDRITARHLGGDLLVQVCGSDPVVTTLAQDAVGGAVAGHGGRLRWSQRGFRPRATGPSGRNLLGFLDGTIGPRTAMQMDRSVWMDAPEPLAGATIAVVRRLRIDVAGFLAQPLAAQESAIGRRRADGVPLSGGRPDDPVDLGAKTPDGRYLVPAMAHVRRAHAGAAGVDLMLRRSYGYDNGPADRGLLFVSFQRDLRTFVATQQRLDEGDDMMAFTTATASGTFLVLPGFTADRPLGAALFGR